LFSEDQTVRFQFSHNVNGRLVYASGTMDALLFLSAKVKTGIKGKMFTMIHVLKGIKNDECRMTNDELRNSSYFKR